MNRTRCAVRLLASEVLPSLVESMQMMNDTLRIQSRILNDHLKFHKPAGREFAQCSTCQGGPVCYCTDTGFPTSPPEGRESS